MLIQTVVHVNSTSIFKTGAGIQKSVLNVVLICFCFSQHRFYFSAQAILNLSCHCMAFNVHMMVEVKS